MTWSIGELGTLAQRAVRGAGQPWGVAEEAGWAVRWLARSGLPGVDVLAAALETGDLGDLLAGIALADRGTAPAHLDPAAILQLPFIGRTAPPGQAHRYRRDDRSFRIWATACDGPLAPGLLTLAASTPVPDMYRHARADPQDRTVGVLQAFAARTYAPASEASRLRGAGAGLVDND